MALAPTGAAVASTSRRASRSGTSRGEVDRAEGLALDGHAEVTTNECLPPVVTSTNCRLVAGPETPRGTLWGPRPPREAARWIFSRRSRQEWAVGDHAQVHFAAHIGVEEMGRRDQPVPCASPASTARDSLGHVRAHGRPPGTPPGDAGGLTRCPATPAVASVRRVRLGGPARWRGPPRASADGAVPRCRRVGVLGDDSSHETGVPGDAHFLRSGSITGSRAARVGVQVLARDHVRPGLTVLFSLERNTRRASYTGLTASCTTTEAHHDVMEATISFQLEQVSWEVTELHESLQGPGRGSCSGCPNRTPALSRRESPG
jgi:hypothetical protein